MVIAVPGFRALGKEAQISVFQEIGNLRNLRRLFSQRTKIIKTHFLSKTFHENSKVFKLNFKIKKKLGSWLFSYFVVYKSFIIFLSL